MALNTNLKNIVPRREKYKRQITLVSGGFYDRQAFPNGAVTVYPWDSAIDAWFQDRLRQPKPEYALWEVVQKVANLNGCKYTAMPVGDIMTILMVSRSIRTDCIVEYVSPCPKCGHVYKDKVAIPGELAKIGEKKPDYPGYDLFTLPDGKEEVQMRVLTVGDEILVAERSDEDRKLISDAELLIIMPVMAVGGGKPDNTQEVISWYNSLSPKDADVLAKMRAKISPQLDPDLKIQCDKCKHIYTHSLNLQQDFFRVD